MDILKQQGLSLEDRIISSYPISISTSLALESLLPSRLPTYDPTRSIPQEIDLNSYNSIYINIFTLYRNISAAVKREVFYKSSPQDIANVINNEIDTITSLFSIEGKNLILPIYYSMSYKKLLSNLPKLNISTRKDRTDFQIEFTNKYKEVLRLLSKESFITFYDSDIEPIENLKTSLILTHIPYDLLSYNRFKKLDLLESNTGKLKTRSKWNTKYMRLPGADMSHIPFLKKLLLVLGDKVMLTPSPIKLRRVILETSLNRNWTSATTIDKVLLDLSLDIKDPYALEWIRKL